MKFFTLTLLLGWLAGALPAQTLLIQDTLLLENFQQDPTDVMLPFPTGRDFLWVNWDVDGEPVQCVSDDSFAVVTSRWFRDGDLGMDPTSGNWAFTSCSWGQNEAIQSLNWLITPPIDVADNGYYLCWRSLAYQGPQFMDGYKVLVSVDSNYFDAAHPADTLFKAAEMLSVKVGHAYSLDLNDYIFSDGYIQANGYTDEQYFFLDPVLGPNGLYHGNLEPHCVSLAPYAGKTVYIAFLHDSYDDYLIQVDDIVISKTAIGTQEPRELVRFGIQPNPVHDVAMLSWEMTAPTAVHLRVTDQAGKVFWENNFDKSQRVNFRFDAQKMPAGLYFCTLQTQGGQVVRRLIKI